MGGCLDLVVFVKVTLGPPLLGIQHSVNLNGASVRIQLTFLVPGLLLNIGMLMMLPWRRRIIPMFGLMVAGRISLQSVGLQFICLLLKLPFDCSVWRTAEEYGDARLERCRAFLLVSGVMQTVQRAEFWGAIVAMQAYWPCHVGIDNLNVARTIGRLLDKDCLVKPLPLVKDGVLVTLVQYIIRTRGRETVRVTKVKGHAEGSDVQQGRVRLEDQLVNAEADTAADLGRRHQFEVLIDARRRLLKVRSHWYPIMLDLHRFMIAVARVTVNPDGMLLIPLSGMRVVLKRHSSLLLGLMLILPLFPALLAFRVGPGFRFMVVAYLVLILLPSLTVLVFCENLLLFFGTLHWPTGSGNMAILGFLFGASDPFRAMGWTPVAR